MSNFTHLHVHSQYSILDGATKVPALIKKAKELGMTAIALTDHGVMYGIKKFFNTAKAEGIKPILGIETYIAPTSRHEKKPIKGKKPSYHLILLAKNHEGYKNLLKLATLASIEGFYYRPRIDKEILEKYSNGLIVTSACLGGELAQLIMNGEIENAIETAKWYKKIFGEDYYIELMLHPPTEFNPNPSTYNKQKQVNEQLIEIAKQLDIKCIATNDIHYLKKSDAYAHNVLINLNTKSSDDEESSMAYSGQEYLKSLEEMLELFPDFPEAVYNTQEIAEKVEDFDINSSAIMPIFELPEGFTDDFEYLKYITYQGAKKRWGENLNDETKKRLDFELETIGKMGFPGYFLIVADFIEAARNMGVSVGPGRGSAAGSAVAYCLKITNIDPIKYDLLFERFLNPDRISMPDIDIDFDDDGRGRVLDWVADKYGKQRVSHIITFGTMAARSAIRDVARVLNIPLSEADRIAKLIDEKAKSYKEAYEMSPELAKIKDEATGEMTKLFEYAETLEGTIRQVGVHACGTIIGKDDLENYIPLTKHKDAKLLVTQFEGSLVEEVGLLKMDFLGLATLSIINDAMRLLKQNKGIEFDIDEISLDDPKVFELFAQGNTTGIFQFESDGMKKYLKALKPSMFEDIIAMNALYRPGPMDYIQDFVDRKHGVKKIVYDAPGMEEFLSYTYGITVYQEQVMLLSQKLAGFSKGEADNLRKAMGKKKKDIIDKMKPKFIEGCSKNNIENTIAEKIWTDWEAFAAYAFNKSHSTCYAYLAYQTAFLKTYYPAEFFAALLTRNSGKIEDVALYIEDARKNGIDVLGPDVNESFNQFSVNSKGQVRFGLTAIKGIGEGVVENIVKERLKNGQFTDIYDFLERVNGGSVNKRVLESLVLSGAVDSISQFKRYEYFSENNEKLTFVDVLLKYSSKYHSDKNNTSTSLFGGETEIQITKPKPFAASPWAELERLNKEKEVIGIYLSSHPLSQHFAVIKAYTNTSLSQMANLEQFANKEIRIAGIVTEVENRMSKTGSQFAFLSIEDFSGSFKFPLFSQQYITYKNFLEKNLKLFIVGNVKPRRDNPNQFEFSVKSINLLENMDIKNIAVKIKIDQINDQLIGQLTDTFEKNQGNSVVQFLIYEPESKVWVMMNSGKFKINVNNEVLSILKNLDLETKVS